MNGPKRIYMIGIGGIGMSALAQFYLKRGDRVSGSDRESGPATEMLEKLGIEISYGQRVAKVPEDTDLVIYSDAIPESHIERAQAREFRKNQKSLFEAEGAISKGMTTIAVAGTHGKTTTTAMLTKILVDAGKNPTAIIGSIVKDFGSNFVSGSSDLLVIEACEYRDHLLQLHPKILVITNIEWDHTDWFKTEADMRQTFQKAIDAVPEDGKVIDQSVYQSEPAYELQLIGEFNQDNARAAGAAAKAMFPDITNEQIAQSLKTFHGTWRRFEYKGKTASGAEVYDDYAHHPSAVRVTLEGVREKFPDKRIVVVFHPHLYSRTRDLFDEFVLELGKADRIILAPIYGAREDPIPGITSDEMAKALARTNTHVVALPTFEAIVEALSDVGAGDLVITMGAGDVYKVADLIAT
jgi:UDP-N-acetylmuramate--alanine ligase